jgi:glycosyltransferase involved in cell wall biosynthesis
MTKVLLVANTDWYLFNFRLSLARFLRGQGYEVILCSPEGRYAPAFEKHGFRWVPWKVGRKTLAPWSELASLWRLARIYRREQAHLVHHHTIKPVLYGTFAARLAGVKGIVNSITGRGYVFLGEDLRAGLLKRLVRFLFRPAFAPANCTLIFENEFDRRYFTQEKLAPADRTWLIEGVGVDVDLFVPQPEPEGRPVILMAARMLWDKGVGVLVEAARRLHTRIEARVVLVGEPDPGNPNSVDEQTLRQWHAEGAVEWWGWRENMPEVYGCCHIAVLPTMYGEGVPTSLLEAAACARPIVATDIPGCRAVVIDGENGLLVPPNRPAELALALERLVQDPGLRGRMGAAGRKLILEKYTDRRVNEATLGVYLATLGHE